MRTAIAISPGVLAKEQIEQLFRNGMIVCHQHGDLKIDASAFDLRLSDRAWKLNEGQRPSTRELAKIQAKSEEIKPISNSSEEDSSEGYFLFEKEKIYLVELDHYLKLPGNINGRATGRSSIG